jgi:hypothetical protein
MRLILPAVFTSSLLLTLAAAESGMPTLLDLPAPVKATIQRESTGHHVAAIERDQREGRTVFRVRIAQEGIDKRMVIDTDGTVLEVSDYPAVNNALATGKEAGKEAWGKTRDVATRTWEATKETVNTATEAFKSDDLTLNQVPRAPRETMERQAAGNRLSGIRARREGAGTHYHATITTPDGMKRTIVVADDGTLVP